MYKTVLVADVHLRDTDMIPWEDEKGLSIRTKDKLNNLETAIDFAIDGNFNSFIVAGDLFHNTRPSNQLKTATSKILAKLIRNKIHLYLIGGNHDTTNGNYYNMMSESNFSDYISFTMNQTISTKTETSLHLLSWNNRSELEPDDNTILISHLQIESAEYGNERLAKTGTSIKDIKGYKKAYLGHLHKRQKTKHYNYIGSLNINDFGERNNPTGFLTLTLKNNKVIEQYHNTRDKEFIKKTIDIQTQDDIKQKFEGEDLRDVVLKLEINLPEETHIDRKMIESFFYNDKNVYYLAPINYNRDTDLQEQSIKVGIKDDEAFEEFAKEKEINDFYKQVGLKILKKVENENK
jgi:DNA repair exonuclease SbcCD nuclease subunit